MGSLDGPRFQFDSVLQRLSLFCLFVCRNMSRRKIISNMQVIRQNRPVITPTKTAVKAIRRLPSNRPRVGVAPITRPLDQLIQVPKWASFLAVEAALAHEVWLTIAGSTEAARNNRLTNGY